MSKASTWRTAAVLGVIGASVIAGAGAAKAETSSSPATASAAAATPSFEIFYGLNCSSASRIYTGANHGEAWINDTFNSTQYGSAGSGQRIRNNAASIRTLNVQSVNIKGNDGTYITFYTHGNCASLESAYGNRRNNNIGWQTVPVGGWNG
ncbi:hypothetical protein ACR8AL_03655 [Clavibacter sepedonicus]|uniref:hypothetical protein n=1 Tax=Clavibacter TaxID=1573 RepID=UPI000B34A62C|nr:MULTISPECIES: hypothetical protein [Clavibacter]OQJ48921.1 hypothetical protein B5P19_12215 [Clavibacter sepedonicus]OQJ53768.1 hypothetical protein B5P20_06235 [Clavibacter sepedonicus]UUK65271.1 hypothetical protein LRE50_13465 [Clavibacter sepedonicus]